MHKHNYKFLFRTYDLGLMFFECDSWVCSNHTISVAPWAWKVMLEGRMPNLWDELTYYDDLAKESN